MILFLLDYGPHFPISPHLIGEGNGTPLQYSCLENPMDGGAWKAVAIHTSTAEEWAFVQYPLLTLTVTVLLSVGQCEIKCYFNIIYYLLGIF